MPEYVLINPEKHLNAGFKRNADYGFASTMSVVPLSKDEISLAMAEMPIAFTKIQKNNTESFDLVALQSLVPEKNYFVLPDGRWIKGYRPAFYRSYPFMLVPASQAPKKDENGSVHIQLSLAIEKASLIEVAGDSDERFFDDDKKFSQGIQNTLKFLSENIKSRQQTTMLCQQLAKYQLITPWKIEFNEPGKDGKQERKVLSGLYHIDKEALNGLAPEALAALQKTGALALVYGQLLSEVRLRNLAERQNVINSLGDKLNNKAKTAEEPDLENLFDGGDDLISF